MIAPKLRASQLIFLNEIKKKFVEKEEEQKRTNERKKLFKYN